MAVDYFLKIVGIEGESLDDTHQNEIEVVCFEWGEENPADFSKGTGGGCGKVNMGTLNFATHVGKATPKLMHACATGKHFPEATLICRKGGSGPQQEEFYKITLKPVVVAKYQTSSHNGSSQRQSAGDGPWDQVSLAFGEISFEYKPQEADGTVAQPVKAGYSLERNKAL